MRKEPESAAPFRVGKALTTLLLTTALLQSGHARGGSHSGSGSQDSGGTHGGFHGGGFHRHGFRGGLGVVIAPAIGGTWLGAGLNWPCYSYPDESY
jgi:hypothetical protein